MEAQRKEVREIRNEKELEEDIRISLHSPRSFKQ